MPRKSLNESVADENAAPGGVAAVDRALSVLSAFQDGDAALSLAELAERTRLYKSTVLRLLASLEHGGWVQRQDDGRYAVGSAVARLHAVYEQSFSLDKLVMPVLRALVQATGESAAYHVRQGRERLCLYRVDSPHPVRDHARAGDLLPLDKGAGGRVLVAFDPELGDWLKKNRNHYARVRADGYEALVGDRHSEIAGISAPVFRRSGDLAAALTLTMPAHRYDERYVKNVLQAARDLGAQLP
ncbi:HTH-type transcriptional regulator KipR [Comamonas sp. PE63]|uniref:HTH-type transcriptional regulator KipR n=1 Tax=Comamonas brasiliensis TaxID=1812482 RepID=A0ABS5LNE5_9BURK|nr:IclR family transcriptional regulator [Comamonas sp. PE63]MBS3017882.1 HTH-type transcriptional regulator KipR [Comamonas sp. PE63]